jgi:spore maturation protein CgeB
MNADHNMFSLAEKGVKNVTWIHQGFSPEFFGVTDVSDMSAPSEYYADVAMIGSMGKPIYTKRSELVVRLRKEGIDIKWWGPRLARQMRNIRYFYGGVHRSWAGSEVYMKDFADVIRHTRIFVGQDADTPFRGKYLSNRSFAVIGCGGFYLCRRTSGIESIYDIGREMDVFETDDELIEKIHYYLNRGEERKRMALAGQRRVLTDYTYKKQMGKIFDWVLGNLREAE